jgi:hypothetical protein
MHKSSELLGHVPECGMLAHVFGQLHARSEVLRQWGRRDLHARSQRLLGPRNPNFVWSAPGLLGCGRNGVMRVPDRPGVQRAWEHLRKRNPSRNLRRRSARVPVPTVNDHLHERRVQRGSVLHERLRQWNQTVSCHEQHPNSDLHDWRERMHDLVAVILFGWSCLRASRWCLVRRSAVGRVAHAQQSGRR